MSAGAARTNKFHVTRVEVLLMSTLRGAANIYKHFLIQRFAVGDHVHTHLSGYHNISIHVGAGATAHFNGFTLVEAVASFMYEFITEITAAGQEGTVCYLRQVTEPTVRNLLFWDFLSSLCPQEMKTVSQIKR